MCKFKVGDTVKLISDTVNNTPMTVQGYRKDETAYSEAQKFLDEIPDDILKAVKCVWRDSNDVPHSEYYHEDTLSPC